MWLKFLRLGSGITINRDYDLITWHFENPLGTCELCKMGSALEGVEITLKNFSYFSNGMISIEVKYLKR